MKIYHKGEYERNRLARYQILVQHKEYLDKLFWSRVQILYLIQAGVLGGSFYLWQYLSSHKPLLIGLMALGIFLTAILFRVAYCGRKDAISNDTALYKLGDSLGIRWCARRDVKIFWVFREKSLISKMLMGHKLFYAVFGVFIGVDSALMGYFLTHVPNC